MQNARRLQFGKFQGFGLLILLWFSYSYPVRHLSAIMAAQLPHDYENPHPQKNIEAKLSSGINVDINPVNADGPRKFSGVATSGLPFSLWGWNTVIDLDNIQHKPKVAILHEHKQPVWPGWTLR